MLIDEGVLDVEREEHPPLLDELDPYGDAYDPRNAFLDGE